MVQKIQTRATKTVNQMVPEDLSFKLKLKLIVFFISQFYASNCLR